MILALIPRKLAPAKPQCQGFSSIKLLENAKPSFSVGVEPIETISSSLLTAKVLVPNIFEKLPLFLTMPTKEAYAKKPQCYLEPGVELISPVGHTTSALENVSNLFMEGAGGLKIISLLENSAKRHVVVMKNQK